MKKNKRGQSIIEVVIATTLIAMGIIAALSLTNQSQKSNTYAKLLENAISYNTQLADYLRNLKIGTGYESIAEKFAADSTNNLATYCLTSLPANTTDFYALTPSTCDQAANFIENTIFTRELQVDTTNAAAGSLKFNIATSWQDSTTHITNLDLELTKW